MLPNRNGLASTIVVVVLLTSKYAAHVSSTSASLNESVRALSRISCACSPFPYTMMSSLMFFVDLMLLMTFLMCSRKISLADDIRSVFCICIGLYVF